MGAGSIPARPTKNQSFRCDRSGPANLNTLDTVFCLEAVQEAIDHYGTPEIFNTDQGSQLTSLAFTDLMKVNGLRISMDGKGS